MRYMVILLPLMVAACSERAWYDAAQTASCESAGEHHGVHCVGQNSDAYRAMKRDEAQRKNVR